MISRVSSPRPRMVMIHGSAADHTTWSIQLAGSLRESFTLIAYDRRIDAGSVEEHADDARAKLDRPALVIGSSFGAVVALALVRRYPAVCAGAILIEPPLPPGDDVVSDATAFTADFDRRV